MRGVGFTLTVIGVIALIAAFMMNTSVATAAGASIKSVELMADRQLYMLMAGLLVVAGVLMVLLTGKNLLGKSGDDHPQ